MKHPFKKRDTDRLQYEFLPAALEIIETPPSPFGRIILWLITALLAIAFIWAYVGKIDVIASGQGKVVPQGNVKTIQPATGGIVSSIRVSEGERVKKDQLLMELDSTLATSEARAIEKSLTIANLERDILKKTLSGEDISELINNADIPDNMKSDLLQLSQSQSSVPQVRREFLSISITQANSQLVLEQQNLAKLQENLSGANAHRQEVEQQLSQASDAEKFTLQNELQQVNSQISSLENAISAQNQRVIQAQSVVAEARGNLRNYEAQYGSETNSSIVDQDKHITELEESLAKAKKNAELLAIKAPVDGTILSISTTTVGGVVTTAQPLIVIVPDSTPLIIEATLQNKDVGFVQVGQKVAIKVDTYSFQRYGYLTGTVKSISPDTFDDEKQGPIYRIKITIDSDKSSKDNTITVSPGMSVVSEITTDKRRIIDFFLDPFLTHTDDSLKVR